MHTPELNDDDDARIEDLTAIVVAKVMEELNSGSKPIGVSDLAIGSIACTAAGAQLLGVSLRRNSLN